MPRHLNANYSLVGRSLFVVGSFLIIADSARDGFAQTKPLAKASQSTQSAAVIEVLKTSFGPALEPAIRFKPFYLTGDFNGDGVQDVAIVVRIKGRRRDLAPDVKVLNPFDDGPRVTFPADPAAEPTLAFAIIHGSAAGWKTSQPAGKFLLLGESPILILEYDRSTGKPEDAKDLMEIMTKRARRRRGQAWPPATAKGDSIVLETEAINSILYWNGKTYRWEESEGGE